MWNPTNIITVLYDIFLLKMEFLQTKQGNTTYLWCLFSCELQVNLYPENEDTVKSAAVPNFVQDYEHLEVNQEKGQVNQEMGWLRHEETVVPQTTDESITLCHIEDLQGLPSGLRVVIQAPSESDCQALQMSGPQTLTGTTLTARSSGSSAIQTNPVLPSRISSLKEPTSVAITGRPKLYARKSTPLWKINL